MQKIYHLGTCNTCKKVIAQINADNRFELQDIKTEPLTAEQLDGLQARVGSYEALFSRRARKYRSQGWADRELSEADYRRLILEEYTFLKRPVVVVGEEVFVGSSKAAVQGALEALAPQ
jgi:arsenate reductase (glutaredoxin)